MTFSIVAREPSSDAVGVAVHSKFVSVGSVVPFAAADAGAVATQSSANVEYGPDGLALLREGHTAAVVENALARGWDDADGTGKARLVAAVWHGLSEHDRV